jgi:DivIVA domain-containing protein
VRKLRTLRSGCGATTAARVNALIRQVTEAVSSGDESRREEALRALRAPNLNVRLRGYDREQVDMFLFRLAEAFS